MLAEHATMMDAAKAQLHQSSGAMQLLLRLQVRLGGSNAPRAADDHAVIGAHLRAFAHAGASLQQRWR